MNANIRPEIAHLASPIRDVKPWPGNPRKGDHADIAAKLQTFGQYQAILVQKSSGHIVVGNNRWQAAKERLGWTHMAMVFLDIDDATAAKMLAADNKASDLGSYDKGLLAEFLNGLDGLEGTGWDFDELDDLLSELASGFAPAAADDAPPPWQIGPVPPVLAQPPATDAAYAETPEEEAARAAARASQTPRYAQGLVELVVVYTETDKAEAVQHINMLRKRLGSDLKASEIVLRSLRMAVHAVDNASFMPPDLIKHAGLDG